MQKLCLALNPSIHHYWNFKMTNLPRWSVFLAFTFLCQTHKKQLMGSNTFLSDLLVRRKKMIWEKKVLFHHLHKEHLHQEIWEPIQLHKNNQYCFFRTVCRVIFIFFSSNVQNVSHNQLRRSLLPLESFKNVFGCFSN